MNEPWLSGPVAGWDALLAPVYHSFEQTRQELAQHTEGLTVPDLWWRALGLTPVGFHIRHIGGAADRLSTYLAGGQLSADQLAAMKAEGDLGADREQLLAALASDLSRCLDRIRQLDPASLREPRGVGRKMLPTTVQGLLVHIAEHTQRHLGQAITTIKLVRATREAT